MGELHWISTQNSRFCTWKWGLSSKRRDSFGNHDDFRFQPLTFQGCMIRLKFAWVDWGFIIQDLICSLKIQRSKFVSFLNDKVLHIFCVSILAFPNPSISWWRFGGRRLIRWQRPWRPMVLLLGRFHVELNPVARWQRWWRIFAPPRSPKKRQIKTSPKSNLPEACSDHEHFGSVTFLLLQKHWSPLDSKTHGKNRDFERTKIWDLYIYRRTRTHLITHTRPGFCLGKESFVLLLSLEHAASGTNLTAANHVIFVHPMNAETLGTAVAYERQALARVRRVGQERSEVHVWRFIAKDTVEEYMHKWLSGRPGITMCFEGFIFIPYLYTCSHHI